MKTNGKIALVVVFAIIGLAVLYSGQLPSTPLTTTQPSTSTGFTSTLSAPTQTYKGAVTMAVQLINALNSTTFTDSTHADIEYFYKDSTGGYNFVVTSAGNTATIGSALTGGFVYANVDIQASQAVYHDVAGTIAKSPDVKGCVYEDPDGDNMNMYVCQIDISPYLTNSAPALTPRVDWIVSLYGEDSIDLNSPTGIANVATGNTINVIDYEVTVDDLATAEYVKKVHVRTNFTTASLLVDSNSFIALPWGKLYLSEMTKSTDFSNTRFIYEKIYPTNAPIDGAKAIIVGNSGSRTVQIPMTIQTGFTASTDAICIELELTTISARGIETATAAKNSDDVEITAASAVNAECTL